MERYKHKYKYKYIYKYKLIQSDHQHRQLLRAGPCWEKQAQTNTNTIKNTKTNTEQIQFIIAQQNPKYQKKMTNLDQYGPIWTNPTNLDQSGQIWTNLDQLYFGRICTLSSSQSSRRGGERNMKLRTKYKYKYK